MIFITWFNRKLLQYRIEFGRLNIYGVGNTFIAFELRGKVPEENIATALKYLSRITHNFPLKFKEQNQTPSPSAGAYIKHEIQSSVKFSKLLQAAIEAECLSVGAQIGLKYLRVKEE